MLESYLISVAIKSTVLLAAGIICLRLLRAGEAAVRHLVCVLALTSAAAVPLLALWAPQWSFLISVPAGPHPGPGGGDIGTGLWTWPMTLAAIWAVGALGMMLRAAGGWLVMLRVRRHAARFQKSDGVEVRIGNVSIPLTCGVLRPLILLPEAARDWDGSRLGPVLLHEAAHVRRRDCMAKYMAQSSRALMWWNPLAWLLAARLNREQELACDDMVLAAGVPAEDYATVLMDVARECAGSLLLGCAMAGSGGASVLRERFTHLFEWRREAARSTRRMAMAIPVLLVFMTTFSFAEKIYKVGPGIVPPKVLQQSEPQYTDEAKAAKLEGIVALTMVVGTDQRAHDVKVTRSLDPGLDSNAVASIKTWRFQPGTKNGKAVPVRAEVEVNFRLQ
jgi:TonB family protein